MKVSIISPEDGSTIYTDTITPTESTTEDFSTYLDSETSDSTSSSLSSTMTLDEIFQEASETYGVDVNLLKAIAKQESNFDPDATSSCGAQGIMQLMPGTAEGLGVTDAYDPYENIMGGAKYISQMLTKYNGDTSLALAAYNAGSGNVDKYGGIPPFTETQNYVTKVLGYYENGVDVPTVSYTKSTASREEIAEDLSTLLQEFPNHSSYQQFLALLNEQEILNPSTTILANNSATTDNASLSSTTSNSSDAYTAYENLLGNTNQAILNMLSELS